MAAVLFLPALKCFFTRPVDDPDVWWHLRAGQWIVEHCDLPTTDSFSWRGFGRPWIAYSWLAELVLFWLYSLWGLRGLLLYTAGLCAAIAWAFHRMLARFPLPGLLDLILVLVAILGLLPVMTPRPWLLSILFFVVELDILLSAGRSGSRRLLWWLVPLFMVWANVHIQFITGLVVLAVALVEPLLARLWPRWAVDRRWQPVSFGWMLAVFVLCVAATMVNPYHVRLYAVAAQLLGQSELWDLIQELLAMPFRSPPHWIVLAAALGAAFALGWRRRFRPLLVGLFVLGVYVGFRSQRDVWFVLLVSLTIVADAASRTFRLRLPLPRPGRWLVPGLVGLAAVIGCFVVGEGQLREKVEGKFPAGAVRFIAQHDYRGPLFNPFSWGGFLIFFLPEHRVNIDGRTIVHGQQRVVRHAQTLQGQAGWREDSELAQARLVIVPSRGPLASLLRLDARFRLVYGDDVAAVFSANSDSDAQRNPTCLAKLR